MLVYYRWLFLRGLLYLRKKYRSPQFFTCTGNFSPKVLQKLNHEVCSHKLSTNPLELSQYNLIHFAMPVAIRKVHAEYHDSVGIRKAMDSRTAACSCKLGCI